jgi:hypothetical protein
MTSTEHFIPKASIIKKCRCNLERSKCKFSPCPACHARGPCAHCIDGQRRTKCKYWEAREAIVGELQKKLLTREWWPQ